MIDMNHMMSSTVVPCRHLSFNGQPHIFDRAKHPLEAKLRGIRNSEARASGMHMAGYQIGKVQPLVILVGRENLAC